CARYITIAAAGTGDAFDFW
nr:immunoglobulin heavy chain junction region [Macaca mulatta]MOX92217.1 immunoglobulin heavy chain junction region [Macaca mulatta]MOX93577.1 immunoglobulin heavy chain junction region [Macaca mulatta]MOX93852.1 immunoglobulin heavy chain junction region [Macaca mulatta]MOX94372.1 immunoglobulin heavy chain junction region [Macaca mulatta]